MKPTYERDSGRGKVPGLYRVTYPSGRVVWELRLSIGGQKRTEKLGDDGPGFKRPQARGAARARRLEVLSPYAAQQNKLQIVTVADLMRWHIEVHSGVRTRKGSAEATRNRVARYIIPTIGHLELLTLRTGDVQAWMLQLRKMKHARGGYVSGATANRCLAALSKAINNAITQFELLPRNPCQGVEKFREVKATRRLKDGEYKRLKAAIEETPDLWPPAAACLKLILFTGLRHSEARLLTWDRVDTARNVLHFHDHGETADSKTGEGTRQLSAEAMAIIETMRGRHRSVVFPSEKGTPVHLKWWWDKVRAHAELGDVKIHTLRHAWATKAYESGLDAETIRQLLGHAKIETTLRYLHPSADFLREQANLAAKSISDI